jgi:phosphatidate cytidylyltransferase
MNIQKVISRLLVFFIGLPLTLAIVFFFPARNHLMANIVITALCGIGAFELTAMFAAKEVRLNRIIAVILGMTLPAAAALQVSFALDTAFIYAVFLGMLYITLKTAFAPQSRMTGTLQTFAAETALFLYPGLLLSPVIFLGARPDSSFALLFFLSVVIINDSFAWLFGILLGRGNRGMIKVSPNKSIAGFAGGLLSASVAGYFMISYFKGYFIDQFGQFIEQYGAFDLSFSGIIIAFATAAAATLGDLAESALKRSAGVKDSGRLFPGRGGVLDSLDSIALAAPVFYALYTLYAPSAG